MTAAVTVNGTRLSYEERGSGDTVVLVHGSAGDRRTWHEQLATFGGRFRTLAYSRRYHWPNEGIEPGGEYSLDEHAADLEAILGELDAAPAHLVGHSYGAVVCLLLAMRAPLRVRSLVLAEPPLVNLFVSLPPKPLDLLRVAVSDPLTAAGIVKLGAFGLGPATKAAERRDVEGVMRRTGNAILGARHFRALSEDRARQVRDNMIPEELTSRSCLPRLSAQRVRDVEAPVLLLGGSESPFVFGRLLRVLERLLPRAQRREVSGASHLMHEDNPRDFDAEVLCFLTPQSS